MGQETRKKQLSFITYSCRFTLTELLVVVSIFALLLAILEPSLRRAMDSSRTIQCASYLKEAGMANDSWVEDFDGRFSGFMWSSTSGGGGGSVSWHQALNIHVYGQKLWGEKFPHLWRFPFKDSTTLPTTGLVCPTLTFTGDIYAGTYVRNFNCTGGPNWGIYPKEGIYGTIPRDSPPEFQKPTFPTFYLGARANIFESPDRKIMIQDEGSGSAGSASYPYLPPNPLGTEYRHGMNTSKNVLFMDAHLETLDNLVDTNQKIWYEPDL